MKQILIACISILSINAKAQSNAQAFDWAMNPGANNNSLYALHHDNQGNLLVLAHASDSASFGSNIISAAPSSGYPTNNYYLGKRNINGTSQIVLQSRVGTANLFSNFSDFNLDNNNNIIIVGSTSAGHDFGNGITLTNKGYIIAKYSGNGIAQWAKMYNFGNPNMSAFTSKPWHIQCLPNGEIVAVLKESTRFAYIKLDANGNELLYREYKITTNGTTSQINTSKNNCFMDNTGAFYLYYNTVDNTATPKLKLSTVTNSITTPFDSISITNPSHPAVSYLLAFRPGGSKKYFKGFRGSLNDLAVEDSTGNLLFSWIQYGGQNNAAPMNMISTNTGSFSQVYRGVIAVDSVCNFIKKSTETPSLQYSYESLLPLGNFKIIGTLKYANGNTLVAGSQTYSISSGGMFTWLELDQNLVPNYFVAAPLYNQNNCLAENTMSNANNKIAVGLTWISTVQTTININGTVLTANNKNTSFPLRYNPPFNSKGFDIGIAQFDRSLQGTVTNLDNNKNETQPKLKVYPNPTNGILNIKTNLLAEKAIHIKIINLLGEVVLTETIINTGAVINLSKLKAGIYLVSAENEDTQFAEKIIIE